MSDPVEVRVCGACDRSAPCHDDCVEWHREPGVGTATLVGRDALVMAWARAKLAYDAAWDRWYHGTRELPVPSGAYDAELSALIEAENALRTWDAGTDNERGTE